MSNIYEKSIIEHKKYKGKLEINSKVPLTTKEDLATYYSPWVTAPCLEINKEEEKAYEYTWKHNSVAVVSDWTAVLWLGNIWWIAWLPVMEWKAILFKEFWWVDAIPIVLKSTNPEDTINTCINISPTFWWINLEDIKAPECFYIEETLKEKLNIPVFHDDQHGTAIVVLAWLINSLKLKWEKITNQKIIISWAWAAWIAIAKLLELYWAKHIILIDSKWAINKDRKDLNKYKEELLNLNINNEFWELSKIIKWADIFIWVSWQENQLKKEDVKNMNEKPIIFALSNPWPEIHPIEAKAWGAFIIATWRSDYPNQLNNILVFPWFFRWILDKRITKITEEHKIAAAIALSEYVSNLNTDCIVPNPLDKNVWNIIANSLIK